MAPLLFVHDIAAIESTYDDVLLQVEGNAATGKCRI